jgi:membrane-bound ClpP family serine protease
MEHIKLFEEFNTTSLNIAEVNRFMNTKAYSTIMLMYQQLPSSLQNKVYDYVTKDKINVDDILTTIKKYNLADKIKSLFNSGITNIKDIYNSLFKEKNESVFWGVVLVIVGILVVLSEKRGCLGLVAAIVCIVFGVQMCNDSKKLPDVQINVTEPPKEEKTNKFVVDGKEVELRIERDSSGNYIVVKNDSIK